MKLRFYMLVTVSILLFSGLIFCSSCTQNDGSDTASEIQSTIDLAVLEKSISIDYCFAAPTVSDSGVSIKGLHGSLTGYELPVSEVIVALPQDTTADDLKIETVGSGVIEGVKIEKVKIGTLGNNTVSSGSATASLMVQEKSGIYYAVFTVFPCSYDEETGKLTYCTGIKLSASLDQMEWDMMRIDEDTLSWLRARVQNPEMLNSYHQQLKSYYERYLK